MNSREDLHFNLLEWPTGSKSVDQELHAVINRARDLEAVLYESYEAILGGQIGRATLLMATALKGKST